MSNKIFSALALLCLSSLTLAGCGNSPYPPGETARPIAYRALGGELKTMDPAIAYTVTEANVIDTIYPSYYQYHYLKQDPYTLQLSLGAEEAVRVPYTFTDKDGKTVKGEQYTFHIKKGLRFQNDACFPGGKGREITAADFLYSFRRMANPESPVRSFIADKILGFEEHIARSEARLAKKQDVDTETPVPGLVADPTDPYTFHIRLNQPYPQLRFLMAMHFTAPVPREAIQKYGDEFARHPVGCGPYYMAEYTPKQRIVLKVNPNRHEEFYPTEGDPGDREAGLLADAGKRLPLCDMVVFSFVREATTRWNLFQQGYLDGAVVTQDNYRQVLSSPSQLSPEMERKGVRLRRAAAPNISYFAFRMDDPVVGGYTPQKRKLRQAISLAIDSQAYLDLFLQGRGKLAQAIIPPGLFGYEEDYKNPYRQHSVEKAKQLLAEAGYPGGIDPKTNDRLTITYDIPEAGAAGRQEAGLIVKQLAAIGIKLEVRGWRDVVWEERVHKGQFQLIDYGWLADYPDPENFVFLLYGKNKGVNYSGYDNPEYNRLFEQMRAMEDGPARLAIIRKMRAIAQEDCPWIYTLHSESLSIGYDWAKNIKPHGVANDTAKYIAVDGPRRARLQQAWNRPNFWPLVIAAIFLFAGSIPAVATVRQRRNRIVRRSEDSAPAAAAAAPSSEEAR